MDKAKLKLYRDYEEKSELEGSYHVLIYGSYINKKQYDIIKETELFKKYSLYLYGYSDKGEKFIGFEYCRIYGLYDKLHYTYGDKLSFTQAKVPNEIKALFKESYPKLKGSSHALIQNVRCSHYTSANVMHGYWITTKEINDKICDCPQHGENKFKTYGFDLDIMNAGHNMIDTNSTPGDYFIGITIKRLAYNDGYTDHKTLAKQLLKTYYSEDSGLPERDIILKVLKKLDPMFNTDCLTQFPMLCLIQCMCYCCT